jgi:hypothetical protein
MVQTLTDEEANELVRLVLDRLRELGATDVIEGIDESRRLGVEESVEKRPLDGHGGPSNEVKQLGTVRRRPPTDREMLHLVLERLRQRVVILPAIARVLLKELKTSDLCWRVDGEFVPIDRSVALEGRLTDLLPDGSDAVDVAYRRIADLIPDYAPRGGRNG